MPTGMALSYMPHIKWYYQLVTQLTCSQPTLYLPAEQVSGQAPTAEQVSGQSPNRQGDVALLHLCIHSLKQRVHAATQQHRKPVSKKLTEPDNVQCKRCAMLMLNYV